MLLCVVSILALSNRLKQNSKYLLGRGVGWGYEFSRDVFLFFKGGSLAGRFVFSLMLVEILRSNTRWGAMNLYHGSWYEIMQLTESIALRNNLC